MIRNSFNLSMLKWQVYVQDAAGPGYLPLAPYIRKSMKKKSETSCIQELCWQKNPTAILSHVQNDTKKRETKIKRVAVFRKQCIEYIRG